MRQLFALACIAILSACSGSGADGEAPEAPVQFEEASADTVQHGQRLSRVLGCSGCHGEKLTGQNWSEPGFGRLWTANLTQVAPQYSDQQLASMIRSGARPDGSQLWEMPSHLFTHLSEQEMAALIAYLRSKPPAGETHPPPAFEAGGRAEIAEGRLKPSPAHVREEGRQWPPNTGPQHALGRYIVRATCAECHGLNLAGGQPHPEAAPRPDLRIIMPAYDRGAFERLLRTGTAVGDRQVGLMSEVATGRYSHLTDRELDAVHAYLQAVAQLP